MNDNALSPGEQLLIEKYFFIQSEIERLEVEAWGILDELGIKDIEEDSYRGVYDDGHKQKRPEVHDKGYRRHR